MFYKFEMNSEIFVQGPYKHKGFLFVEDVVDFEVVDYETISLTASTNKILSDDLIKHLNKPIYLLADTSDTINFGHFFYESFIFLSDYLKYNKIYNEVIIITKKITQFKIKIFNYYGFKFSDSINDQNNYFGVFPLLTSCINNKFSYRYSEILERFYYEINNDIYAFSHKDISVLMFPRHKKVDNTPTLERDVETEELENFISTIPGSLIINSESSLDWGREIEAVRRSVIIILTEGSSYSVLAFHARNSKIIVLGSRNWYLQTKRFDKLQMQHNLIKKTNEVYFIDKDPMIFEPNDILPLLSGKIRSF